MDPDRLGRELVAFKRGRGDVGRAGARAGVAGHVAEAEVEVLPTRLADLAVPAEGAAPRIRRTLRRLRDRPDEFLHRVFGLDPGSARDGIARAVVHADLQAEPSRLLGGEAQVRPPDVVHVAHARAELVFHRLVAPGPGMGGDREDRRAAHPRRLHRLQVARDAVRAHVVADPVPPGVDARLLRRVAEVLLQRRRAHPKRDRKQSPRANHHMLVSHTNVFPSTLLLHT